MPDFFFLRNNEEAYRIFGAIEHLEYLTLEERFTIAKVPIHVRRVPAGAAKNKNFQDVLGIFVDLIEQYVKDRSPELVKAIENEDIDSSHIFNMVLLPSHFNLGYEFLNRQEYTLEDVSELESMSHVCDCYLWLNSAFPSSFADTSRCITVKDRCHELID